MKIVDPYRASSVQKYRTRYVTLDRLKYCKFGHTIGSPTVAHDSWIIVVEDF